MNIHSVFFDKSGRLRSGWRFGIFSVLFVIASVILSGAVGLGLRALSIPLLPGSTTSFVASGLVLLVPALLLGWLCGRVLERVPFRALGASFTPGWAKHLFAGLLFGAGSVAFAVLLAFIFGGLEFDLSALDTGAMVRSLATSFVVFAVGAAAEEALFRGYILQTFARSGLAPLAIALTAIFFGIVHLGNPGTGVISTINTVLAGVWLGIAYMKTRDLWFVWGEHLMWNWTQGAFFGIEVSGLTNLVSTPVLKEIDHGPGWLTGEYYGIEGGIVTTVALIASTAALYLMPFIRPSEDMKALTSSTSDSPISPRLS